MSRVTSSNQGQMDQQSSKWLWRGAKWLLLAICTGIISFIFNCNDLCGFSDRLGLKSERICGPKSPDLKPIAYDLSQIFHAPDLPSLRIEEQWYNTDTKEWKYQIPNNVSRITAKKLIFRAVDHTEYAHTIDELNTEITTSMANSEYVVEFFKKCIESHAEDAPGSRMSGTDLDDRLERLVNIYKENNANANQGIEGDASVTVESSIHLEAVLKHNHDGFISILIESRRFCPLWDTAPTIFRYAINYDLMMPDGKRSLKQTDNAVRSLSNKCEALDGVLFFSESGAGCLAKMEAYNENGRYVPRDIFPYDELRKQITDPILGFQIDRWLGLPLSH